MVGKQYHTHNVYNPKHANINTHNYTFINIIPCIHSPNYIHQTHSSIIIHRESEPEMGEAHGKAIGLVLVEWCATKAWGVAE